jgi:hypothetical protein
MSDIGELLWRGVDTNEPPDKTDEVMAKGAAEIERLRAERDELLAALKALSKDHNEFWGAQPGGWKSADAARAAIAKVEKREVTADAPPAPALSAPKAEE